MQVNNQQEVTMNSEKKKMDEETMEEARNQVNKLEEDPDQARIRPSNKRYIVLVLYCICSMEKSFQWINLSTITNKVALYYGVDNIAVNWSSVLFMITFIPLVLPTGWLIERIGLRKAILIGSTGIASGAAIKCFSCAEDRFWVVILGQIVVSLSEQFIFCVPARIASVWFPDHQISLATGFGIFGNQCGIALGFLIPQAMLDGLDTRAEIGYGLQRLFLWTAIVAAVTLLVLIVLFDDAPKRAPGLARLRKLEAEQAERATRRSFNEEMQLFGALICQLLANKNCLLLTLAYGVNVGTGYAIQTLLNQMIIKAGWPDANRLVSTAGLLVIFCGMLGALFWGHLCDLTHRYMLINKVLYIGAILSMAAFGFTLRLFNVTLMYIAAGFLGFNLIGYNVVGLDTAVELTYPAPELISTSIMNLSPQIFGTGITFLCSAVVDTYDSDAATAFLVGSLVLGLIITLIIKEHLNRQAAVKGKKEQPAREVNNLRSIT